MCSRKRKSDISPLRLSGYNYYTFEEIVRAVIEKQVNNPKPRRQFDIPYKNYVPDWLMKWSGRSKEESHEERNETV